MDGNQSNLVCFDILLFEGSRKKMELGLVLFACMLTVRFSGGMRGAGTERIVDNYTWREGWQVVCRDVGLGQTVDILVQTTTENLCRQL